MRATYLYAGMTDVAALLDPPGDRPARGLWTDVVSKRLYITGGIGARGGTESFGDDYELPNLRALHRDLRGRGPGAVGAPDVPAAGDARYLDLAEHVLYNGALSGVSISGNRFFYQNPLASDGRAERSPYFEVACCPANLARTMAQLPGLIYATSDSTLYVRLFGQQRDDGDRRDTLRVTQRTRYPWDGEIELRVEPEQTATFELAVRVPGWTRGRRSRRCHRRPVSLHDGACPRRR